MRPLFPSSLVNGRYGDPEVYRCARSVLYLRCRRCNTAPGADELVIESAKVHLVLGAVAGLLAGHTGPGLVLNGYVESPAFACMSRAHFCCCDRVDFTEILTLLVAE